MADPTLLQLCRTRLVEVSGNVAASWTRARESECAERTPHDFTYRSGYLRHVEIGDVVADAVGAVLRRRRSVHAELFAHGRREPDLTVDETLLREIAPAEMREPAIRCASPCACASIRARCSWHCLRLVFTKARPTRSKPSLALALDLACDRPAPGASQAAARVASASWIAPGVLVRDLLPSLVLAGSRCRGRRRSLSDTKFPRVEGVPLYRYQLRLRLARAGSDHRDLGALSHDLGFSSHSHFGSAFQQACGRTPRHSASSCCSHGSVPGLPKEFDSGPQGRPASVTAGRSRESERTRR